MTIRDVQCKTGWGVLREEPWHFVGLFDTQLEAAAKAIDMGAGYAAHHGAAPHGNHFVWVAGDA